MDTATLLTENGASYRYAHSFHDDASVRTATNLSEMSYASSTISVVSVVPNEPKIITTKVSPPAEDQHIEAVTTIIQQQKREKQQRDQQQMVQQLNNTILLGKPNDNKKSFPQRAEQPSQERQEHKQKLQWTAPKTVTTTTLVEAVRDRKLCGVVSTEPVRSGQLTMTVQCSGPAFSADSSNSYTEPVVKGMLFQVSVVFRTCINMVF